MPDRPGPWVAALILLVVIPAAAHAQAEDWGAYAIVPASAPGLTLEVVGARSVERAVVSIGRPNHATAQKWTITPVAHSLRPIAR